MTILRQEVASGDGTRIPVWISGSGPTVLIVHGAATDRGSWEAVRAELEADLSVAAMDRRATFGDPLTPYEYTREFDDVAAVARSLDNLHAILGHSSGAQCALGAAPQLPELAHLLLYEPPLDQGPQYPPVLQELYAMLRAGDIDGVYDTWLKRYVGMPEEIAEEVKASPIGQEIRRFAEYLPREMAAHLGWHIDTEAFTSIQAQTTFLVGSETPPANQQLRGFIPILEKAVPRFQVVELPGQAHFANTLDPALLARIVKETIR